MKANRLALMASLLLMLLLVPAKSSAQVNAQLFYDFGSDRKFMTLTLEMFKADKWGNTYFFVDHDFNYDQHVEGPNLAPGGTYLEIARCLNFWQESPLKALSLHVEYKNVRKHSSDVPMQLTAVWAMNDLFGVKGLKFDGFADFWWEDHDCLNDDGEWEKKSTVFITEPQLWYNVGQHFGVDNLSVGSEIELTNNFGSTPGFKCRPCLGIKWDF